MPTREELTLALTKADAAATAGDQSAAADARKLAMMIRDLDAAPAAPAPVAKAPPASMAPAAKAPPAPVEKPVGAGLMAAAGGNRAMVNAGGDPLAPVDPVNQAMLARQRDNEMEARRAQQVADAHAQYQAREAQAASDKFNAGYRDSLSPIDRMRYDVSNAVRGGAAAAENAAFTPVNTLLAKIDPNRQAADFIQSQVTPAAQAVGQMIEGPSGRFGGVPGALAGGLTEWGATTARDPRQGLTEAVDMLEPTHLAAQGYNQIIDAAGDVIDGPTADTAQKFQQGIINLGTGGLGMVPAGSVTVEALRNAYKAPARALEQQMARVAPIADDAARVAPTAAPSAAPVQPQAASQPPVPVQTATAPPAGSQPPVAGPTVAAGAVPPAAAVQIPPVGAALTREEARAADLFIRKLEADGLTMDDIVKIRNSMARRGDSGVYETSGELAGLSGKSSGANLRGLQMAGGAAPGPLQEALVSVVNENAKRMPERLSRGATRATGQKAENAVATLDELDQRLKTEATPAYDEAYAEPVDPNVFANEILPVLNTPSGQEAIQAARNNLAAVAADLQGRAARGGSPRAQMEWQRAQKAVKSIDAYMADPVRGSSIPTTMALDYTKRAFDDVIAKAGFGSDTARIVGGTKRNFADSVNQATGGKYGRALGVYEDIKRLENAFDTGLNALTKKTWELERDLAKGRGGSPYSGGEVEALAMGVARHIEDLIETNDQAALTKLLKGKALKNMATALGSEKAAKQFEQTIRRLGANREWGRRVAGGSDTAMRQAAIRDAGMETEDAVTRVLDRVESSGNTFSLPGLVNDIAVKPIARTGKKLYQQMRYPGVYDEGVNRALIPLIATPMTPKNLDEIIRIVEARQAQKATKGRKASPAPAPSAPGKKPPRSGSNDAGFAGIGPMATLAGASGGAMAGAAMPADSDNERFMNMLFGAAGGTTAGALTGKLIKGGKKPPPKASPSAGPRNALAPEAAERPSVQRSYFAGPRGDTYEVTIEGTGRGAEVNFRPQGGDYAVSGNMSLAEVNDVFRNVEKAIRDDIATNPKLRYVLEGATKQRRDIYEQIAKTRPAPEGYRWEMVSESGRRPYLTLTQSDAPPPASAPKPPPVKNGFGSSKLPMDEASRMQRARDMGFDVDTPLYHGTASDVEAFDPSKFGNATGAQSAKLGVWLTSSPDTAAGYAKFAAEDTPVSKILKLANEAERKGNFDEAALLERAAEYKERDITINGGRGANVMPVYVRGRLKTIDMGGAKYDPADTPLSEIAKQAKAEGYDGIRLSNFSDEAGWGQYNATDHVLVFHPSNIRGKFAKFDPAESNSSKLLAGMADNATGYGTAGGAIAGGTFARDTNGDGVVDANERAAGAVGGAITGGIAGKAIGAGARRMGKAPPMRNAPRRGPDQATFAGVNAKTADRAALARAQQMEASGADRNAIWDETGWFKGVDGKWRFEIDDSRSTYNELANGQDYLTHPDGMFKAYRDVPGMQDLDDVRIFRTGRPDEGSFRGAGTSIESVHIGKGSSDPRSVALHEYQHGIQAREDFARGGSPDNATRSLGFLPDPVVVQQADYLVEMAKRYYNGSVDDAARELRPLGADEWQTAAIGIARDDPARIEVLKEKLNLAANPYETYRRLAGETEARNVQTRRDFTPEQRRAKRPWETQDVPDDQQIVRFGGGKAESRPIKPPPAQSGFGGGNKLKGPQKSKSRIPGEIGRRVAVGATTGAAISLANDASAQDDLSAEIRKAEGDIGSLEQEIAALKKAKADFDNITDPFEKQRFLKARGLYAGRVEGDIAGKTTEGINAWDKQNADALAKAEAALQASQSKLAEMRKRDAQRQMQKEQLPFADALRDFGPTTAMVLGGIAAGVLRMRGVGKSAKAVKAIENDINDLLTKGPVKNLVKKGGVANEERNRAVNMNQFYREGGAPDSKLPFTYGPSGWKANPKAAKPGSLYPRRVLEKMDGVGSTLIRAGDIKLIGTGLLDSALTTPLVESAQRELDDAEADLENNKDSIEAMRRVERAKTNLAMYQALQRAGWGVAAGGILSAAYRYKLPKPDIRGAEDEVTAIADYLKTKAPPTPVAPPKAPPAPPLQAMAAPSNQLLLPLGLPPKKPKKSKKP